MRLTKEQQQSLLRKWQQNDQGISFLAFRRGATPLLAGDGCVMVQWSGMWLGIETNGDCHS